MTQRRLSFPYPFSTIAPCLPKPAKEPPIGPGWIHEIKHDGFRVLARRGGGRVRLYTATATIPPPAFRAYEHERRFEPLDCLE